MTENSETKNNMLMKKLFTLCTGLVLALTLQAQNDCPLQFADKDGNIIADGTTLNISEAEEDEFGSVLMPSGLYVKNTSEADVHCSGVYTVQSISNGGFQTCFPENCLAPNTKAGQYTTQEGTINAGVLKSMQTEWLPEAEGKCVVTYQIITYKQNVITKKWNVDKQGPTVTLNFTYTSTAIGQTKSAKAVRSVAYYNLTGRRVQTPAKGIYIVKTTYQDGTVTSRKMTKNY